jgi:hypothetical protein
LNSSVALPIVKNDSISKISKNLKKKKMSLMEINKQVTLKPNSTIMKLKDFIYKKKTKRIIRWI